MSSQLTRLFEVDPWKIIEKEFDSQKNEISESVFSLANEYMGSRGMFEEGLPENTLEGCYVGGMYVKERQVYPWQRIGFPNYSNTIINTTNWQRLYIEVAGERFSMLDSKYSDYSRSLDMKKGLLDRKLVFETSAGYRTELKWQRLVSHCDKHIAAVRVSVKALNHNEKITLSFVLDSRKENRDRLNTITHCKQAYAKADANDLLLLMHIQTTGQYYINQMKIDTHEIDKADELYFQGNRLVGYSFSFIPKKGVEYKADKIVSIWTSREKGYPHGLVPKESDIKEIDKNEEQEMIEFLLDKSKSNLEQYNSRGYEYVRKQHAAKVAAMWNQLDVQIDGDDAAQQGVRFCIFQLAGTYMGLDSYLNIAPKGHTGENYDGRTFWDSESYCFPFYLLTNPTAARGLIEYRYKGLDAARARAKELSYDGAMYPMTTIDGTEDCSVWENSLLEIHINSTIAYVVYLYSTITGDDDYLYSKGAELLAEIARFWASRATFIPSRNGYGINRVIGPDEWQQFVNNNFYTNFMAKWVLRYAGEVIEKTKQQPPEKYAQLKVKINLKDDEPQKWLDVAEKMILNYDSELGVFIQDDMFLSLDPICREQLVMGKDIPIERNWSIEKYLRIQMTKQPDVLLAMFLFGDKFTHKEKENNYRFYEQRTAHGSSLSPCIHSILASEVGRHQQAYEYYQWASRLDLDDRNNSTHEGLHISSMAGSWLNIICGFGGMKYSGACLEFSPILPEAWQSYSFRFVYRQSVLEVALDQQQVKCKVVSGPAVKIKIYGNDTKVSNAGVSFEQQRKISQSPKLQAVIFDLDGVIVDTARYHYLAWEKIADDEDIYFDENINERLKGVSRMESLKIIMEKSSREYSPSELENLAESKNQIYVNFLDEIQPSDMLEGIEGLINELRDSKIKTAICSASCNTNKVLEKLKIEHMFDAIVTGDHVTESKPSPEGMLIASEELETVPANCVVIEDAFAGIQAALAAGMKSIGVGDKMLLHNADYTLPKPKFITVKTIKALF